MSFKRREQQESVKLALISSTFHRQDVLINAFPTQLIADKAKIQLQI